MRRTRLHISTSAIKSFHSHGEMELGKAQHTALAMITATAVSPDVPVTLLRADEVIE
jgi:hypothetical protein